ncbi:hypothetical protein CR513_53372, partial [Mucuna pruriens]
MVVTYKDWHKTLPYALHGYRTSVRTSTRATPYSLAVLPIEVEIPTLRVLGEVELEEVEWIQQRLDQLNLIEDVSQLYAMANSTQKRVKKAFDKKVKPRVFKEGDMGLKKMLSNLKDQRGKWAPKYEGPYVVRRAFFRGAVILTNAEGRDLKYPVNADSVKMRRATIRQQKTGGKYRDQITISITLCNYFGGGSSRRETSFPSLTSLVIEYGLKSKFGAKRAIYRRALLKPSSCWSTIAPSKRSTLVARRYLSLLAVVTSTSRVVDLALVAFSIGPNLALASLSKVKTTSTLITRDRAALRSLDIVFKAFCASAKATFNFIISASDAFALAFHFVASALVLTTLVFDFITSASVVAALVFIDDASDFEEARSAHKPSPSTFSLATSAFIRSPSAFSSLLTFDLFDPFNQASRHFQRGQRSDVIGRQHVECTINAGNDQESSIILGDKTRRKHTLDIQVQSPQGLHIRRGVETRSTP